MPTIRVEEEVDVPREALFAELADHAGMGRFRPVKAAALLQEGATERNGKGALRRVHFRPAGHVEEEITAYDAPTSFGYRIRKSRPLPIAHEGGRIELQTTESGRTRVLWTSTYEIPIPIVGGPLGRRFADLLESGFRQIIADAAEIAAAKG